jgi:NAD(P)-dependent dehydrogenase (short-subunit alcohol dehydrogenase family)
MDHFDGSVAVVTGGASGIGLAIARRFAAEKIKVVLADVEPGALAASAATLRQTGAEVLDVVTDVSDPEAVEALARKTVERFGKVNVICNNAGVQRSAPTWGLSLNEWRWMVDVNLLGVVHGIRSFVPRMLAQRDPCYVVNTASFGGLITAPYMSAYAATKFAVVALSESMHAELMNTNVGVSVLCPAFVKTRLGDADRNKPSSIDEGLSPDELEQRQNIGRAAAALVEAGIDVEIVADCVLEAMIKRRFYVITHPEQIGAVKKRTDAILKAATEAAEFLATRQQRG